MLGSVWLAALAPALLVSSLRVSTWTAIICGLVATIPYVLLLVQAGRGRASFSAVLTVGLAARALALVPADGFSDDLYRYLWEGRVVLAGENPYQHPPADLALANLRDDAVWPRVTHGTVPAAYPPLAQAFFAAVSWTWATPRGMRGALVVIDLLVWISLAMLLRSRGRPPALAALWGLSPLVVLEVGASGHVDVLAVLFSILAFLALARGRPLSAASSLALATLAKPYALVLIPVLALRTRWVAQSALFAAVLLAGYLPFSADGPPTSGLQRYSLEWTHNAAFYPAFHRWAEATKEWLTGVLEGRGYSHEFRAHFYAWDPNLIARGGLLVLWLLAAVWAVRRGGRPEARGAALLAALVILSPTVHPWYLLWFLPFLAFRRDLGGGLLLWSSTVLLSYHVLPRFDELSLWEESRAWRALEYVPVFLWFAVVCARRSLGAGGTCASAQREEPGEDDQREGDRPADALGVRSV